MGTTRLDLEAVPPPSDGDDWHGGNSRLWRADVGGEVLVIKRFDGDYLAEVDAAALERLVIFARTCGAHLAKTAVWPTSLLVAGDAAIGTAMPALPERFFVNHWGEQRVRDATLLTLRRDDAKDCGVSYVDPPHRLAVLGRLLKGLLDLHSAGVVVNDLQATNVALSESLEEVRFLDCDSMFGPWGRPNPPVHPADAQLVDFVGGQTGDLQLFSLLALNILQSELGTVPLRRAVLERVIRSAHIDLLADLLAGREVDARVLSSAAAAWIDQVQPDGAFVVTGAGRLALWTEAEEREYERAITGELRADQPASRQPQPFSNLPSQFSDPIDASSGARKDRREAAIVVLVLLTLLIILATVVFLRTS